MINMINISGKSTFSNHNDCCCSNCPSQQSETSETTEKKSHFSVNLFLNAIFSVKLILRLILIRLCFMFLSKVMSL